MKLPMFDPQVSLAAGGDPNITYYHSHWAIAADEALLIEVMPPECEHWNFQLNNYWMESLDYRHFRIHTNKHLAHYSRGRLRAPDRGAREPRPSQLGSRPQVTRPAPCVSDGCGRRSIRNPGPD